MTADFEPTRRRLWEIVRPTARKVVTSDPETDGATGSCRCGACGAHIDQNDAFCRRCGAHFEELRANRTPAN